MTDRRVISPAALGTNSSSNEKEPVEKMTERGDSEERTAGGPLGKLAGEAKEAIGSALGNEELAREGRLQKVQVDAEEDAAERAQEAREAESEAELEAERTETEAERRDLEADLRQDAVEDDVERRRREAAMRKAQGKTEADRLEREAERAERVADAVDPEEESR